MTNPILDGQTTVIKTQLDRAASAVADLTLIALKKPYARGSWTPSDYATLRDTALCELDRVIDDLELSTDMHDRARELADALSELGQEAHDSDDPERDHGPIARMRSEIRLFLFTLTGAWVSQTARNILPEHIHSPAE